MSCALKGVEMRYPHVELLALALVVTTHWLRPNFQTHSTTLLVD